MSVRKRSWKTAKGVAKEAWIVDYVDQSGERHIKTFAKKKEADAYHSTVNVEVAKGIHTPASASITIEKAGELWIEACEEDGLERATVTSYREHLDLHIKPYLGQVKLSELSVPMVGAFRSSLLAGKPAPGQQTAQPRSPVMVKRVIVSLGTLLAEAQENGLVAQNVIRSLRSNRKRRAGRVESRQKRKLEIGVDIPSPDEIRALVHSLEGRWRPFLLTAIFTGLRASELRGLRWADVDLVKGELYVRQRADKYQEIGMPKSRSGQRTVPLTPAVVNTLRRWKGPVAVAGEQICPKGDLDLVFPTGAGGIENYSNIVKRGLIPEMIKAGLTVPTLDEAGKAVVDKDGQAVMGAKYTGLHSLRHFYASWCINRKRDRGLELPLKVVQERLGHSTIVMTADTYGHLFPQNDAGAELAAAEEALLAVV